MTQGTGRLQDRVAVITGGAAGIGKATVQMFVDEGAYVVIGDMNAEAGQGLLDELAEAGHGDRVRFQPVDVSDEDQVEELMQAATSAFGGLDILFNNAGIGGAVGSLFELEAEFWDETFAVLTKGVFLGMKHGGRIMRDSGKGGSIINTASIAALSGRGGPLAYSATKAAVVNMTLNAAVELAPLNIRVNAVCPGVIFTDLMHRGNADQAEKVIQRIQPIPRRGEPEDIASMVRFLASDESTFVTGTTQVVDGGYLAQGTLGVHPLPGVSYRPTYTGMTYGTTGKPNELTRLEPNDG